MCFGIRSYRHLNYPFSVMVTLSMMNFDFGFVWSYHMGLITCIGLVCPDCYEWKVENQCSSLTLSYIHKMSPVWTLEWIVNSCCGCVCLRLRQLDIFIIVSNDDVSEYGWFHLLGFIWSYHMDLIISLGSVF